MITKPPKKNKVEEVINKGGGAPLAPNSAKNEIITTPLRISKGLMWEVDECIKGPYGAKKQSRNSFIINAVINELERNQNAIK
jgi:hypothetical protein